MNPTGSSSRGAETTYSTCDSATTISGQRDRVPALTLVSHPDSTRIGDLFLFSEARSVKLSRTSPVFAPPGELEGRPLDDPYISREPIVLKRLPNGGLHIKMAGSRTRLVVSGTRATDNLVLHPERVAAGVDLVLGRRLTLWLHLACPGIERAAIDNAGLVGASDALGELRREIDRVADLEVTTLLRGASGTGKERVARAIHDRGPRHGRPWVAVNLGAIPPSLAAAELFGAEKGAYTGAGNDRQGLFVAADGGTLFLDEVGEAPPEVQVLLLRALESGEILPVGARTPRAVDVRVIAATDADLEDRASNGLFRAPLLHRLAGYTVWLPTLASRREDVGRLFLHFARQELERMGEPLPPPPTEGRATPWLPPEVAVRLLRQPWPGNVRQLRNAVRQLVIGNRGEPVLRWTPALDRLLLDGESPTGRLEPPTPEKEKTGRKPSEISAAELVDALRHHRFNFKATAKSLGISRASLYLLVEACPQVRKAQELTAAQIRDALEPCAGDLEAAAEILEVSSRSLKRRLNELGLG